MGSSPWWALVAFLCLACLVDAEEPPEHPSQRHDEEGFSSEQEGGARTPKSEEARLLARMARMQRSWADGASRLEVMEMHQEEADHKARDCPT